MLLTEDRKFRLLELPKFNKKIEELPPGLDPWLYLLRHGETINREQLPAVLPANPFIVRAWEELLVLAQSDQERERYEARRKARLDYNTGLKVARMEGREEGEKIGRIIGMIQMCKRLLQRPKTPSEQLANLSLEELILTSLSWYCACRET